MRWSVGLEKIFSVSSISTSWPGLPRPARLKNAVRSRDPRRLLHVVRDDDDRVLLLERLDQVLDRQRRDRVQRRARLVHQQHLRLDGDRPGDAQPLLLAAGQPGARLVSRSLTSSQRFARAQRLLDDVVQVGLLHPAALQLEPGQRRCRRSTSSGTGSAAGTPCRSCAGRRPGRRCWRRCRRRRAAPCPGRARRRSPRAGG